VADAIWAHLAEKGVSPSDDAPTDIEDLRGQGRTAVFGDRVLSIGGAALFDDPFTPKGISPNHTAVWFGFDREAEGCFLITDEIRKSAKKAIAELGALRITSELVSGDREEVTSFVAKEVGIETSTGDASIDAKIDIVKTRKESGRSTCFVGDGTNDALAMAEAGVSVSLAKATDEALTASGIIAVNGNLDNLHQLFLCGRKLKTIGKQNYFWAFAFNTLFIPVAAMGKLVPLAAMLLMLTSSMVVLLNSLRLR
jgi:Cu+-exporting ATPase